METHTHYVGLGLQYCSTYYKLVIRDNNVIIFQSLDGITLDDTNSPFRDYIFENVPILEFKNIYGHFVGKQGFVIQTEQARYVVCEFRNGGWIWNVYTIEDRIVKYEEYIEKNDDCDENPKSIMYGIGADNSTIFVFENSISLGDVNGCNNAPSVVFRDYVNRMEPILNKLKFMYMRAILSDEEKEDIEDEAENRKNKEEYELMSKSIFVMYPHMKRLPSKKLVFKRSIHIEEVEGNDHNRYAYGCA